MPPREKLLTIEGYEITDPARAFLGEGTYGTVYRAREKATGRYVAIKQQHHIEYEKGISPCVLRETSLLRLLKKSPYVVGLLKVVHVKPSKGHDQPTSYMIFEHLDCDLHVYAGKQRPMPSDSIRRIMYHILLGLHHCHSVGLMHRDLKPHNILLDTSDTARPTAKLADFGFGRSISSMPIRQLTEEIITLWYRPPEVLLGYRGHSPAVDIWSTACILSELYEHVTLFAGHSQFEQLMLIFRLIGTPSLEEWKALRCCDNWHEFPVMKRQNLRDYFTGTPHDAIDLLESMFIHDPAKRPTAETCLRHPYFSTLFREDDLRMEPLLPSDVVQRPQSVKRPQTSAVLLPSHGPNIFSGEFGKKSGSY